MARPATDATALNKQVAEGFLRLLFVRQERRDLVVKVIFVVVFGFDGPHRIQAGRDVDEIGPSMLQDAE